MFASPQSMSNRFLLVLWEWGVVIGFLGQLAHVVPFSKRTQP